MKSNSKKTQGISVNDRAEIEAIAFAQALREAEVGSERYRQLQAHFCEQVYRAVKAQFCTPFYMTALYPIVRAANIRTEEAKEEEIKSRNRAKKAGGN